MPRFLLRLRSRVIAGAVRQTIQFGFRSTYHGFRSAGLQSPLFLCNVEQANWVAIHDYAPTASDLRVYRCQVLSDWDHLDYTMGWGALAGGGVDFYEIPGNHVSMLRQQGARLVAERLSSYVGCAST